VGVRGRRNKKEGDSDKEERFMEWEETSEVI
jgi:hypothetical protein